jgi:ATP-dependent Clp protease ATP-binding subunit ClpX
MPDTPTKSVPKGKQRCSFCGRNADQTAVMISGPGGVMICDHCIKASNQIIKQNVAKSDSKPLENFPTPAEIKHHLDTYVIGQDVAKRKISVAVYNHYNALTVLFLRVMLSLKSQISFS